MADEILAPDVRFRGTLGTSGSGIDHFKAYFERARKAFPDLHAQIDELIVSGEIVVARLTWSATHAGEIFGIPGTAGGATSAPRSSTSAPAKSKTRGSLGTPRSYGAIGVVPGRR